MRTRLIIGGLYLGSIALGGWNLGSVLVMMHVNLKGLALTLSFAIASILFLLGLAVIYTRRDRWLAALFASVILTGLSLSWLSSFGFFLLALGIILLITSVIKLRKYNALEKMLQAAGKENPSE